VYVIEEDQKANPRPIEVASMQGDLALIGEGLTAGDRVVVEGQFQLRPGSKVSIRPAEPRKPDASPGRAGGVSRDGGAP
jgi:multidrug efflux system membrane fusion protein